MIFVHHVGTSVVFFLAQVVTRFRDRPRNGVTQPLSTVWKTVWKSQEHGGSSKERQGQNSTRLYDGAFPMDADWSSPNIVGTNQKRNDLQRRRRKHGVGKELVSILLPLSECGTTSGQRLQGDRRLLSSPGGKTFQRLPPTVRLLLLQQDSDDEESEENLWEELLWRMGFVLPSVWKTLQGDGGQSTTSCTRESDNGGCQIHVKESWRRTILSLHGETSERNAPTTKVKRKHEHVNDVWGVQQVQRRGENDRKNRRSSSVQDGTLQEGSPQVPTPLWLRRTKGVLQKNRSREK